MFELFNVNVHQKLCLIQKRRLLQVFQSPIVRCIIFEYEKRVLHENHHLDEEFEL